MRKRAACCGFREAEETNGVPFVPDTWYVPICHHHKLPSGVSW